MRQLHVLCFISLVTICQVTIIGCSGGEQAGEDSDSGDRSDSGSGSNPGDSQTDMDAAQDTDTVTGSDSGSADPPSVTGPVITKFALTSPSPTSDSEITFDLDGKDDVEITGWLINGTATQPNLSDPGWKTSKPQGRTLASSCTKTFYAWARDGDDNISPAPTLSITIDFLNINGRENIYLKTLKQTHNDAYYFIVHDSKIFFRPNFEQTGVDENWKELRLHNTLLDDVQEIGADDWILVATNSKREIHSMKNALGGPAQFSWDKKWGAPIWTGPGQVIDEDIGQWTWSIISLNVDEYFIDPAGRHQAVGAANVSHIWWLSTDGERLTFIDPWLPLDYSNEMCGPKRGKFRAVNIVGSGSTLFVINEFGDLFTRTWDYDMAGIDRFFFSYSYDDASTAIHLPPYPWVMHPKIDGPITDNISIYKVGKGAVRRVMRVEGYDEDGHAGFYEKDITETLSQDWIFHRTDYEILGNVLENKGYNSSDETLGQGEDIPSFSRNMDELQQIDNKNRIQNNSDWAGEILGFNCYCSPSTLRIHTGTEASFDLVLHNVDGQRAGLLNLQGTVRERGLDDQPRIQYGTIQIPDDLLNHPDAQDTKTADFINNYLEGGQYTEVTIRATEDQIVLKKEGILGIGGYTIRFDRD